MKKPLRQSNKSTTLPNTEGTSLGPIAELSRSDDLAELRRIVEELLRLPSDFRQLIELPPRIPIVIDANQAYSDILSKVRAKAKNFRTNLEELADAKSIQIHAPNQILNEVDEHLAEVCAKFNLPLARALEAWKEVRSRIEFHETLFDPSITITDPEDAPYIALSNDLGGAIIITRDKAFEKAGASAADPITLIQLKQAVRLSVPITRARVYWLVFLMIFSNAGAEAISAFGRGFANPKIRVIILSLLGIAGIGTVVYLADPERRKRLSARLADLRTQSAPIADAFLEWVRKYEGTKSESREAWEAALPFSNWQEPISEEGEGNLAVPQLKNSSGLAPQ